MNPKSWKIKFLMWGYIVFQPRFFWLWIISIWIFCGLLFLSRIILSEELRYYWFVIATVITIGQFIVRKKGMKRYYHYKKIHDLND